MTLECLARRGRGEGATLDQRDVTISGCAYTGILIRAGAGPRLDLVLTSPADPITSI